MRTYRIPRTDLEVTRIAYGCMTIGGRWDESPATASERQAAFRAVDAALEAGINLFDHADIYTMGKSEALFGEYLRASPGLRDRIVLQSKCGIRFRDQPAPGDPQRYDFSYQHILAAVEGSLRRLQTDALDILLLHRPDPLVEPEEVARAFDDLFSAGKVRYFGVSNHTGPQIELLQEYVRQHLVINQLELSLAHPYLIDEGVIANRAGASGASGAMGTLDYCRSHGILVQAWSPVGGGRFFQPSPGSQGATGSGPDAAAAQTAALMARLAAEKRTSPEAIMLGWLLRHPAGIQPVIGTTRSERIRASCQADAVSLSREEWYALFTAARGAPVP